jgi:probable HAF family extracellular repeat protein
MPNIPIPAGLLTLAACVSVACGGSESLTDPDPPGPDTPNEPNQPNQPPPATLPLRTDLGTLGGASSYAYDVNDNGVVVGAAQTADGAFRGFRWTQSAGLQALAPLPNDMESRAFAIAGDDAVIGLSFAEDGTARPVLWSSAGDVSGLAIPALPGAHLLPNDRNAQGTVVGDAVFDEGEALVHAWVWTPGGSITDLADQLDVPFENYAAAVNEAGTVAGTLGGGLWRAYVWRPDAGARALGAPGSDPQRTEVTAQGVSGTGAVVGWSRLLLGDDPEVPPEPPFPNFGSHAYVWSEAGGFALLPEFAGGGPSEAVGNDLNDRGDVVGSATPPEESAITAVAWPRGGAIVRLNTADPNPSVALAVNNTGIAVGWTSTDGGAGTNRATVWNLEQAVPAVARAVPKVTPRRGARTAVRTYTGAAQCLQLRTRLVTKAALADCFEGRSR